RHMAAAELAPGQKSENGDSRPDLHQFEIAGNGTEESHAGEAATDDADDGQANQSEKEDPAGKGEHGCQPFHEAADLSLQAGCNTGTRRGWGIRHAGCRPIRLSLSYPFGLFMPDRDQ